MSSHMETEQRTSSSLLYDENLYAFLAVEGRQAFCNLTPPQLYPPTVELFRQGSPSQYVYCIESGLVKLVNLTQQGQELIVGLRSPGWILGSVPVIAHKSDTPRKAGGLVSGAASKAVAPAKLIFDNYALRRPMN